MDSLFNFNLINITSSLSLLFCILIILLVLHKNLKSEVNKTFVLFTAATAVWIFTNLMVDLSTTNGQALFWGRATIVGPLFMPTILLYFSYIFPGKKEFHLKPFYYFIFLLPLLLLFVVPTSWNMESVRITKAGVEVVVGPAYTFFLLFVITYMGFALIKLFLKYRKAIGIEKMQLRYVFFGLFLSIVLSTVANLLLPILGVSTFASLGPSSTLIFIGFVSYSIVKHRLLDIEVIIRRSLVYSTLLAILIAMYSGLVFVLNSFFLPGETGVFPRATDVIAIILVAFTIDPLRRIIERSTDKVFFKARYNAEETINRLSETLVTEIDLTHLVREISLVLRNSIKVDKLSIYVKSDHTYFPAAIVNTFPKKLDTIVEKQYFITKYLSEHPQILIIEELQRFMKEGKKLTPELTEAVKTLSKLEVEVVVPLIVKETLTGAMFLGEKRSQDIYSNTDIRFLEILSHQAALSLENAKLYEEQKLYGVRLTKEVERATSDLRHANDRLKELDELKDEFMSIASHELRTPMTAIKSYIWLALHGKVQEKDPKVRTYLDRVFESSERMINMINDMLNVSRIETGRLQLDIIPVSIWKIAEQVRDDLSAKAAEAGVDVIIQKDKIAPLVMSDKDKLTEIFTNLIGNALKFTKRGGRITVSAEKVGEVVEVSVADTGVGIAPENIDKLFKKYGRLDESYATASASTGTGLGLYITKQYLEKMGGKIWIKSILGKGTTFTFSLPVAAGIDLQKHQRQDEQPAGIILNPKLAKRLNLQRQAVKSELGRALATKNL